MSDNVYAHDSGVVTDLFAAGDGNLFQRVMKMRAGDQGRDNQGEDSTALSSNEEPMSLFKTVRPNIVQSIRAFRVQDLADEANQLGQHFLYAYTANAQSKQEVLETIATSFLFPKHFGKNYDALYDCLTDLVHKAGAQPGFVIVLDQLPVAQKFDKEGRETLLDVFREAAEFWAERALEMRPDAVLCTGRTDYPNQVNNVLVFPFLFRGALDVGATTVTREMEIAAVNAIAELARQEQSDIVATAYGIQDLSFGPEYLIPKPFDPRLIVKVARESGKRKKQIGREAGK